MQDLAPRTHSQVGVLRCTFFGHLIAEYSILDAPLQTSIVGREEYRTVRCRLYSAEIGFHTRAHYDTEMDATWFYGSVGQGFGCTRAQNNRVGQRRTETRIEKIGALMFGRRTVTRTLFHDNLVFLTIFFLVRLLFFLLVKIYGLGCKFKTTILLLFFVSIFLSCHTDLLW